MMFSKSGGNIDCTWKDPKGVTYDLARLMNPNNYKVGDDGGEAGKFMQVI